MVETSMKRYIHDNNVHITGWYPYCRWCLSLWPRQVLVLICSRGNTWRCGIHNKKNVGKINGLKSHLKLSRAWDCLTFFQNHLFLVLLDYFKCNAKLNSAIRSRSKVNAKSTTCWLKKPLRADTNSKALSAFQNRLYFFARANY